MCVHGLNVGVIARGTAGGSNFMNRPSVIFFGGNVALVPKYRHIRILGPGTSFGFLEQFHQ